MKMLIGLIISFLVIKILGYKKAYPILILVVLVFPELGYFSTSGFDRGLSFIEVLNFIFFGYSFFIYKNKKFSNQIIRSFLLLFSIYIIHIFAIFIIQSPDLSQLIRYKFFSYELFIFNSYLYFMLYGDKEFIKIFLIGSLILIIRIYYLAFLDQTMKHSASVGFISGILLVVILPEINKLKKGKNIILIVSVLFILASILGASRSSMIAVIIGLFSYFLISHKNNNKKNIIKFVPFFILLVVMYHFLFPILFHVHQGAQDLAELMHKSGDIEYTISTRLTRWEIVQSIIKNNLLFGVGFYKKVLFYHVGNWNTVSIQAAHNYFLSILGGGGLFIFIFMINFYYKIFDTALKKYKLNKSRVIKGITLVLLVININITNVSFARFNISIVIWSIMGLGIYYITTSSNKSIKKIS